MDDQARPGWRAEPRSHTRAARTSPLRGQRVSVGGNTQSHPHRGVRNAVIELEQGRISRSWQPDFTTSRWRPRPDPGLRMFRLVQHEREDRDALAYLWARHPATEGGSVCHVQAVSSRVTPSPPSRRQAACSAVRTTPLITAPGAPKALSPLGKGLELRKLVAGEGFEPSTSGL